MATRFFAATSITAVDAFSVQKVHLDPATTLVDGDICFIGKASTLTAYRLNATSGAAVSSPGVLLPDSEAGDKRWLLLDIDGLITHAASHQNGGGDEVSITGLSGLLADDQHVLDAEVLAAAGANTGITSMTGLNNGGIPLQAIASTYGVSWDEDADTYSRTGSLVGQTTSQTLAAALLPIQSAMRRCVINDAGEVQYYLGATDSYNRVGMSPSITGTDDAGAASKVSDAVLATGTDDVGTASKVSDVGVFTGAESEYLDNLDKIGEVVQ